MGRFSILILTIGIPGSGKSYWVNEYIKTHPLTYVVSNDKLRQELTGTDLCVDPSQNMMIYEEARRRTKKILEDPNSKGGMGPEIIIDATNVDVDEWLRYKEIGASVIVAKVFDISVDEAMKRQEHRERKVPREILEIKKEKLEKNKKFLPFIFNMILD